MKEKLAKLIIMLFESRLQYYTEKTVDIWVELLSPFDYDLIQKKIKKMIFDDTGEKLSIANITSYVQYMEKVLKKNKELEYGRDTLPDMRKTKI